MWLAGPHGARSSNPKSRNLRLPCVCVDPTNAAAKLSPMWSRIRTVLIWLVVAALPVQGWAAASMINCGPAHHRMAAATHPHPDDAMAGEHAGHAHHAASMSHASGDHPQFGSDELGKLGNFKCSGCASCCAAAALPSTVIRLDALAATDFVAPRIPSTVPVFLTDGPDRPPRIFLV